MARCVGLKMDLMLVDFIGVLVERVMSRNVGVVEDVLWCVEVCKDV